MKKNLSVLAFAMAAMAAAGMAHAGEKSGLYVGGNVGYSAATGLNDDSINKDDGASYSVFGGYQLTDNVAAEIGYTKLPKLGTDGATAKSDMWTVQGVFSTPVAQDVSVFGKAGLAFGQMKAGGEKIDGVSPVVGFGAEYAFAPNLSAVGEVSYVHDFGGASHGNMTTSLGLKYRF